MSEKQTRAVARRIQQARFPVIKTLDTFDWNWPTSINADQVPEIAVEHFDGTHGTVWTVEDGVLRRRTVSFGERTLDSRLAISEGLPAGAEVVSTLRAGLREGRRARVTEGRVTEAGAP